MLRRKAINRRENRENNTQRATEKPKHLELCVSLRNPDSYRDSELCGKNVFA